jgi:hypothetical protein
LRYADARLLRTFTALDNLNLVLAGEEREEAMRIIEHALAHWPAKR